MVCKNDFCFLWNFSQFQFCSKLTSNSLRCLHYYSVIIVSLVPLVPSPYMFSC